MTWPKELSNEFNRIKKFMSDSLDFNTKFKKENKCDCVKKYSVGSSVAGHAAIEYGSCKHNAGFNFFDMKSANIPDLEHFLVILLNITLNSKNIEEIEKINIIANQDPELSLMNAFIQIIESFSISKLDQRAIERTVEWLFERYGNTDFEQIASELIESEKSS